MNELQERFEDKFIPEPNSGCWIWIGALDAWRYARFGFRNRNSKASRVAVQLYRGEEPGALCVLHKCDTPECVNPDHLYIGTQLENVQDRVRRGRKGDITGVKNVNHGSNNHSSKLTEEDVHQIRRLLKTQGYKRIAKQFSVSPSSIQGIANGKRWGWLK